LSVPQCIIAIVQFVGVEKQEVAGKQFSRAVQGAVEELVDG